MTWTKLDDNVYDSPAMVRAGEDAADLYVRGLVYCNKHLTDGRIEAEVLSVLTRRRTADQSAAALVRVGAWAVHPDGGWTVANFHEHNPAAEDVIAKRAALAEKRANAGKIGGKRSGQARSNEAKPKQSASDGRSKPEANDDDQSKQTGSKPSDPVEPPSRPVPSSSPSGEGSAHAREDTSDLDGFTLDHAEEVLHTIRDRSRGKFSTRSVVGQLKRFHALCCDLIDGGATREEFEHIGDHIRHGGMAWAKNPDVGLLIAEGKDQRGPQLPRLLAEIDACEECRRALGRRPTGPAVPDLPPPPPPVDPASLPPPLTPEQVRAARPAFFRDRPGLDAGVTGAK